MTDEYLEDQFKRYKRYNRCKFLCNGDDLFVFALHECFDKYFEEHLDEWKADFK